MSEINKEDPKSGFLKERFLRAVNASKEKLNQAIQYRQEREAIKNVASEPVANKAFEDKKLMKEIKPVGRISKSRESDIDSYFESRMANHRKSKGLKFKISAKTLIETSPTPPCCKTPLVNDIEKEEVKLEVKKTETKEDIPDSTENNEPPPNNCQQETENIKSEIVNEISENDSDKIINKKLIKCKVLNISTAEDIINNSDKVINKNLIKCEVLNKNTAEDLIGNNLDKVIEAELVPAVQEAKKKDPNLTKAHSNDKNLIECKVLKENTAEDIFNNSDKIINENLSECKVPESSTADSNNEALEGLQCPYCNDTFENVNLVLHMHIKQSHKEKEKKYLKKLKRRELACKTEKGKEPVSKTPRAPTIRPSQASAT